MDDNTTNNPTEMTFVEPQFRSAAHGLQWLSDGFALFKKDAANWVITLLVGFILAIVIGMIPVLGQLASLLTTYIWTGGLMMGCHAAAKGESFEPKYLFAGFTGPYLMPLVVMSAVVSLVSTAVVFAVMGTAAMPLMMGEGGENLSETEVMAVLQASLLIMLVSLPLIMATWFAPALVVVENMAPLKAMKLSLMACLKNAMPFLLYGLVSLGLMVLCMFTLGLGLLVLMPVVYLSMYTGFRDIFYTTADHNQ
ncbi:hypothetical protein LJ739_12720 [Aestuariibacter halophilus]|uniref:Transmembrane protein n=1 Tax=Fluctibacter halophilus TaxID=226011 RepID=A0ABS8G9D4_9ALTE|nr:BPSS1780 family membrane protein [Aestuariibacter halophilus]MCC2617108.1 hypothetical protein [Aestuariibacter halophilus]